MSSRADRAYEELEKMYSEIPPLSEIGGHAIYEPVNKRYVERDQRWEYPTLLVIPRQSEVWWESAKKKMLVYHVSGVKIVTDSNGDEQVRQITKPIHIKKRFITYDENTYRYLESLDKNESKKGRNTAIMATFRRIDPDKERRERLIKAKGAGYIQQWVKSASIGDIRKILNSISGISYDGKSPDVIVEDAILLSAEKTERFIAALQDIHNISFDDLKALDTEISERKIALEKEVDDFKEKVKTLIVQGVVSYDRAKGLWQTEDDVEILSPKPEEEPLDTLVDFLQNDKKGKQLLKTLLSK